MALPKKGRRSIRIDDVEYHYKIDMERSERAVIQNTHGDGAFLFVFPFAIMKPRHVADAIRFAILCGWKPTRSGSPCWLAFDVDGDDNSYFEHVPNDDFRVVTYPTFGRIPDSVDASQLDDTRKWYDRPSPWQRCQNT